MLENQSTSWNGGACHLRFLGTGTVVAVFELSGGNSLVRLMLKMSRIECIARDVVRLRGFIINILSLMRVKLQKMAKEAQ